MKAFYMEALYMQIVSIVFSFHLHYMSFSTLPLGRNEAKPPAVLRLIGANF